MKALMAHSENSAVGYYRIWQPAKYLEMMGWDIQLTPRKAKPIPIEGKGSWDEMGKGCDIMVWQRPEAVENIALFLAMRDEHKAPFIFEMDDNIYDVAKTSTAYKYWNPNTLDGQARIQVVEMIMQDANAITVTTESLRDTYSHLNDNIYVLPNYQDPEWWKGVKTKHNKDKFIIGWAGSSTHYDDLRSIWRPVKKFLRYHPDAIFKVVGAKADFLVDHPQVEVSTDWVYVDDYPQALADFGFDVGLTPLTNRPFNQGKSNIKWQEYSMIEVPTIASNVGPYQSIEHGVDGFKCNNDTEWHFNLTRMYDDVELRKRIGRQAKQKVVKDYNIESKIGEWDRVYRDVISKFKS